jgi:hypothetical protein
MNIRISLLASCVALPTYAASSFDGQYHGTLSRDPGGYNATTCSQGGNVLMTVEDGKLQYNHFQNAVLKAAVGPDGSFTAKGESRSIRRLADHSPERQDHRRYDRGDRQGREPVQLRARAAEGLTEKA